MFRFFAGDGAGSYRRFLVKRVLSSFWDTVNALAMVAMMAYAAPYVPAEFPVKFLIFVNTILAGLTLWTASSAAIALIESRELSKKDEE